MSEKESIVKRLQKQEEKELILLDELKHISSEREKELARLVSERDATIVNMGLHKYKLKKKVLSVIQEIELDLQMLEKLRTAVIKVRLNLLFVGLYRKSQKSMSSWKPVID